MTVAKFKLNEDRPKIEGMTVFNPNPVNAKKQPMFFGAPLGIQRYDSYKYPVFEKLTQQQLGYFWDLKRSPFKRTEQTMHNYAPSRSISTRRILNTKSCWILYKGVVLGWLLSLTLAYPSLRGL